MEQNNMPSGPQKRQTAYRRTIASIKGAVFEKDETFNSYHIAEYDKKISRVNLVGVIIEAGEPNEKFREFTIEDGTGNISVQIFANNEYLFGKVDQLKAGDVVNLIGRVNKFNEKISVIGECVHKLENTKWIEVHKLATRHLLQKTADQPIIEESAEQVQATQEIVSQPTQQNTRLAEDKASTQEEVIVDKPISTEEEKEKSSPSVDNVIDLIAQHDQGEGADFEEIIQVLQEKHSMDNPEEKINTLLQQGDIFEIRPGKLKVLS